MSSGVSTRSRNKNAHPGRPDAPKFRRPTQEVQAEKQAKTAAKKAELLRQLKALEALASKEDELAEQEEKDDAEANHPPSELDGAAQRTRGKHQSGMKSAASLPSEAEDQDEASETHENARADPSQDNDDLEGEPSGSEFEADKEGGEESESDDKNGADSDGGEGRMLLDDDLELAGIPAKAKQLSKKMGRKDVETIRVKGDKALKGNRRHAASEPDNSHRAVKKPKKVHAVSGLTHEWLQSKATLKAHQAPRPLEVSAVAPDIGVNDYGGLFDESQDREHAALAAPAAAAETQTVASYKKRRSEGEIKASLLVAITPGSATQPERKGKARVRVKVSQLSPELASQFGDKISPLARELAGSMSAWSPLTVDDVVSLLEDVAGSADASKYKVQPGDPLMKLISSRLHTWRNGIATAAEEAVASMIKDDPNLDTQEKIAAFVLFLLGDENMNVPFYYLTWGEGKRKSGRFQHPLIAQTLCYHLVTVVKPVLAIRRQVLYPQGALVHSIQAVHRALQFWKTGMLVKPKGLISHYSADNWGDVRERCEQPDGSTTIRLRKRASKWNSTLDLLDNQEWDSIIQNAYQYSKTEEDVDIPDGVADGGASSGTEDFVLLSDNNSDTDANA